MVQLAQGRHRQGSEGWPSAILLLTTCRQITHIYSVDEGLIKGQPSPAQPRAPLSINAAMNLHRGSERTVHPRAVRLVYDAKFLKWLHEAQYFLTDSGVVGVAERVTRIQPGYAVVSLKGASEDSLFAVKQLPAQQSDHVLLNGVYIHFTQEEVEVHKALVDDLNAGILDTEKISLV
ncbi:uncharacterized protein PgNI_01845 [Pyricularia grisea]|uniref:Uncharacterized protein n=1 Tax=Pyricularia grisea TaxID=148305 RepID=A0A6P8BMK7_PYRGI|nr:uncharacterized protein PgNI_01845 [Pyricularia grisea]TLD17820.1 hypothetical protein PgNI_01845 [Pyricularia grisea]